MQSFLVLSLQCEVAHALYNMGGKTSLFSKWKVCREREN